MVEFRRELGNSIWFIALLALLLGLSYPLLGFIAPGYAILLTYGVIWSIAALGFNLLYGYTGLLSFGHAAFIGIGAYIVALMVKYFNIKSLEVLLLIVLLASIIVALAIGFIVVRYSGIFFAIFMLAIGQILWGLYLKFYNITGGTQGINVPRAALLGFNLDGIDINMYHTLYYYYVLIIAVIMYIIMWYIVNSPLGYTLKAIRDNEVRVAALGVDTFKFKLVAFAISAAYTGLAGALLAPAIRLVTPDLAFWFISGKIAFMTIFGGAQYLVGPIVGAILYAYLEALAIGYTIYWYLVMGLLIIAVMSLAPRGILGLLDGLKSRIKISELWR